MPLPDRSVPWPPAETDRPRALYDAWGAWYSGDPDQLSAYYGGGGGHNRMSPQPRPSQYRGGVIGTVARWFWGAPPNSAQQPTRLHVPIAGDIAAVNADLLFGEPPSLGTEEEGETKPTQDRLDYLMTEGGLRASLLEAAEVCAAYGGVYLRVGWATEAASDHPLVDAIVPDCAAPEWRHGRLHAVTFWRVLSDDDNGTVIRHLERHEPGKVYHGLYEGSRDALGRKLPLADNPETADFKVGPDGSIATGADRIAVEFIPNMLPNRILRGSPLGRSDYQGVEHLMDALDEAWSSWMRDVRLAKARLIVPDAFLDTHGRGQAATFDSEREVYSEMKGLQGVNEKFADMIREVQFDIRVDEHAATCRSLAEQIVRGAGFSAQTFGEGPGDLAVTATEVQHRERRTYSTRARKIGYWQPALGRLLETLLQIDVHIFHTKGITPQRPTIEWPDGVQDAPEATARTIQLLNDAQAVSMRTKVQMAHQDWDDNQVDEEVALIQDENPVVDPMAAAGLVNGQDTPPDAPSEDSPPERDE
ncbi:phage portal protein [Nocardiopsis tropica]|uniref:Phage portal protein n=1 Tax=Nocardiopsis tropica TaxID=109330 RepID=A0ABU7KQV8_9ACTN|nr:phage portal protein [Nocardiopsis umidischolae]MEE2051690.1 phage portal protein [Nocardiopsis umidischolae]